MFRPSSPLLALPLILCALSGPAWAGQFVVTPTRIDLGEAHRSMIFTVRNAGSETLRFQVSAYEWRQELHTDLVLAPTEGLLVYPSLMTLEPGETRRVRVGVLGAITPIEETYRVFIEELPGSVDGAPGVHVLTRVGIPVFVAPDHEDISGSVAGVEMAQGQLRVTLENSGNTHVKVERVDVVGRGAEGAEVGRASIRGWYLLPGAARELDVALPDVFCPEVTDLAILVATDRGEWTSTQRAPDTFCAE